MTLKEYKDLAMRTNDGECTTRLFKTIEDNSVFVESAYHKAYSIRPVKYDIGGILNACLGLPGEVGEVCDTVKKAIFHGHSINMEDLKKEIGDVMWYLAMICDSFGFDIEEIAKMNIDKLKERYPEGFSEYASQHRKEYEHE